MSLWDNKEAALWDKNVPPDLIPAIKCLRDSFDDAHNYFGMLTTMPLCYLQLHNLNEKTGWSEPMEYAKALNQLKPRIGPAAQKKFIDFLSRKTLPATFKAFYDFYIDGLTVQARVIFKQFVEIGRVHEHRLESGHIDWARAQTSLLVRANRHRIKLWIRNVCDEQHYDPADKDPFESYWTKWQAPLFLIMTPSRYQTYEPSRVWERIDNARSLDWLESFADHYVIHIESDIKDDAGLAAIELAKQPKTPLHNASENDSQQTPRIETRNPSVRVPKLTVLRSADSLRQFAISASKEATLKTAEAARIFEVDSKTIARWANAGQLKWGAKRGTITCGSIQRKLKAKRTKESN